MFMSILLARMYVHHMCPGAGRGKKSVSDLLDLELGMDMNHHGSGKQTRVLSKSSKCF